MNFKSPTYGTLSLEEVVNHILDFYTRNKRYASNFELVIGTDSQNHSSSTKIVNVISIICERHGGIFFYHTTYLPLIKDIRSKLHEETNESLTIATELVSILENDEKYEEMYLNIPIKLHIDAGNSELGKTKCLINELVGWVVACGYVACVKPESYAASSIADKISK